MPQVESLVLEVRSNEVSQASRRLDRLGRSAQSTEQASGRLANSNRGLASSFRRTIPVLLAAGAAAASFRKALDIGVATQDFKARLKTATGSIEDANAAFEALEGFATRTPYALEQSLEAFTKLTNLGLTPSERALESYGNTAAAMGKDLTQLIEAVADATTNEFERLKEFGIKAKQQGDQVSFTFRGVTKTIGKNAEEIEKYLMSLGENEFAGAMANQMDTLGGKVSNLGDAWNQLWRNINEAGVGDLMKESLQLGIDALTELNHLMESGVVEAELKAWTVGFESWADDFAAIMDFTSSIVENSTDAWGEEVGDVMEFLIKSIQTAPAAFTAFWKGIGAGFTTLAMMAKESAKAVVEIFVAKFEELLETAAAFGVAIGRALNPVDKTGVRDAFVKAMDARAEAMEKSGERINSAIAQTRIEVGFWKEVAGDAFEEIWDGYTDVGDKIDDTRAKAQRLREELEKKLNTPKVEGDRLGKYRITPSEVPQLLKRPEDERLGPEQADKEFTQLLDSLRAEERALEGSYLKRLEIVRKNTVAGSEIRAEMEEKLRQEYEKNISSFEDRKIRELDFQRSNWQLELDELKDFYARRHEIIMNAESLTGEERNKMVAELEREKNDLIAQMEQERMIQGLGMAKDMFGNYAKLAQSNNETLSKIGQAALKAQKAVAVTQAIIDTYKSANAAYSAMAGIPVVGPALGVAAAGAAVAAGIANVAAIRAAPVGGSFEQGGIVPGTSFSGDNVVANVNSGEMILNKQQQAKLFDIANRGGSGGITIINQTTGRIDKAESVMLPSGERQIIIQEAVQATEAKLTKDSNYGGGSFVPSLTRNFGMQRTA
jgi:hypothetical protein